MRSGKLFSPSLELKPATTVPRLAVRRWAFWNDRGELLRDVDNLGDGVNLIWSADTSATPQGAARAGHGVGKSTFCRLLRYGLGEPLPEELRHRLVHAFGDARFGVVVEIDGERLAVVRSIQNEHAAAVIDEATFLEAPAAAFKVRSALAPLLERLGGLFSPPNPQAWTDLLPVLTRDQDARREITSWRDSGSGRREDRSAALLQCLGLYSKTVGTAEADTLARKREEEDAERAAVTAALQARFAALGHAARLRKELGLSKGASDEDDLVGSAETIFEVASQKASQSTIPPRLLDLRARRDSMAEERRALERDIAQADAHIGTAAEGIAVLARARTDAEGNEAEQSRAARAAPTVCVTCGQVLAGNDAKEHCRQEQERALAATKANLADIAQKLALAAETRRQWQAKREQASDDAAALQLRAKPLLDELEGAEASLQQGIGRARQLEADAQDLVSLVTRPPRQPLKRTRSPVRDAAVEGDVARRRTQLRDTYDAVLREVLGDDAHAELTMEGNVIESSLVLDGPTGGTALRVLSVLAFDVATMLLRADGHVPGPAFLMHDSPRDGDMSPLYYESYLRLFSVLEALGGTCFQAIVTTTTAPPDEQYFRDRTRLHLRGAAQERLLRQAF